MDLEYLLKGIKDGTVTIIDLEKESKDRRVCYNMKPDEVESAEKYMVVRFDRDIIGGKAYYLISVVGRKV